MDAHGLDYVNDIDEDAVMAFAEDLLKAVQNVIDTEPTAYDPDKVVEQLEMYSNADEAEQVGTVPVVELNDAIEIVKAGGINDNSN